MAFLYFILTVGLPGAAMISFFWPCHLSGRRALALFYGIGTAMVSLELLLYFVILRRPFSSGLLWFFGIQAAIALGIIIWRFPWKRQFNYQSLKFKPLAWVLGALIAALLFLSLIQAVGKPPVAFDSLAFWAMRAEILLTHGRVEFDPSSPTYLSAIHHENYPWHLSAMEYWFRLLGGEGGPLNLIAWFYFASLALLLFDFLKPRLGTIKSLLMSLFFASQPFIFYHASNNYADLIIGYYVAVGFAFFFDWLEQRRTSELIFAAAFFGFTLNIKNYGSFYILAFIGGLFLVWLFRLGLPKWKTLGLTILALILPLLPIGLFKSVFRLNLRNTDPAWVVHPEVWRSFVEMFSISNNWNIWWIVFAFLAILYVPTIWRERRLAVAWLMFSAVVAILVLVFIFTENYQWALDHTALSRAFIPIVAVSMMLLGLTMKERKIS